MKTYQLSGVVGWEINTTSVSQMLNESNGEDITMFIDSVGGSVFEGIKIFNLIKNYKGKTTCVMSGICASMGSYIPLAFDEVMIEENAMYMIHNPWSIAIGDYRDFEKQAGVLKGIRNILAKEYTKATEKKEKEIYDLLDAESWFFGQEIIDNKFASSVYSGNLEVSEDYKKDEDEDEEGYLSRMKALANMKMEDAKEKAKKLDTLENMQSVLNMYGMAEQTGETKVINSSITTETGAIASKKGEKSMNLNELKANHIDLYNQIFQMGVDSEKERVQAHLTMAEVSKDLVLENIQSGASFDNQVVRAKYLKAEMKTETAKGAIAGLKEDQADDLDISASTADRKIEDDESEEDKLVKAIAEKVSNKLGK